MEKIYYKGKLLRTSQLQNISFAIGDLQNYGFNSEADKFLDFLKTQEVEAHGKLISEFNSIKNNETISLSSPDLSNIKQAINNQFLNMYQQQLLQKVDIIFEVINTKNGELYGKELHTGLLFPIVDSSKIKYKLSRTSLNNVVKCGNTIYFLTKGLYYNNFKDGEKYYIKNYKKSFSVKYYNNTGVPYFYKLDETNIKYYPKVVFF